MNQEDQQIIFVKPTWEAYNQAANQWIDYVLAQTSGLIGTPKERIAIAAFLKVAPASYFSEKQKPLAAPRGNNHWSKYPLVGRKIMKRVVDALDGKFIHQLADTGKRNFYKSDDGKCQYEDIATLYEVDPKLVGYTNFKTSEFIETGRRLVSIGKYETYAQKRRREDLNKPKPKLLDTEANKSFGSEIFKLRDEVEELNKFWLDHPICLPGFQGSKIYGASAERVFHNGDITKGGRFYGLWTPNKEQRKKATIDGESVVQIDLNAAQAVVFSSLMGMKIKDTGRDGGAWYDLYGEMAEEYAKGDPEKLEDYRELLKAVAVELVGTGNPQKAKPSPELQEEYDLHEWLWEDYRDKILTWVPSFQKLNRQHLNGDGFITYHESKIMLKTIQTLHKQGVPAFPMHDCLIVKETDLDMGAKTFIQTANSYILDFCRNNNLPEINVMLAYSTEGQNIGKKRYKGFYLD